MWPTLKSMKTFERNGSKAVAAFEQFLKHSKAVSAHTLRAYLADLREFESYLAHREVGLFDASHLHVRGFLGLLAESKAATSRARKLASIKSFFKFLVRRGELDVNPAARVKSPKLPKRLPKVLPVDEAFALMEAPTGKKQEMAGLTRVLSLRDRAILEVL